MADTTWLSSILAKLLMQKGEALEETHTAGKVQLIRVVAKGMCS